LLLFELGGGSDGGIPSVFRITVLPGWMRVYLFLFGIIEGVPAASILHTYMPARLISQSNKFAFEIVPRTTITIDKMGTMFILVCALNSFGCTVYKCAAAARPCDRVMGSCKYFQYASRPYFSDSFASLDVSARQLANALFSISDAADALGHQTWALQK
jgi:hypothetical protein